MPRILVIDDDDALRAMLGKLFGNAGYEVVVAQNGVEAGLIQKQKPADLILTDLIMPDKEGIEVIIEFKRDYPATPIIAMSGGGRINSVQYLKLAANLGARRTFAKPFKAREILTAVEELLKAED